MLRFVQSLESRQRISRHVKTCLLTGFISEHVCIYYLTLLHLKQPALTQFVPFRAGHRTRCWFLAAGADVMKELLTSARCVTVVSDAEALLCSVSVCQCFAVLEDGALAHNLQEQESKYSCSARAAR